MTKLDEIFTRANELYDEENYDEAVKWYRKAAEQGFAKAQDSLG